MEGCVAGDWVVTSLLTLVTLWIYLREIKLVLDRALQILIWLLFLVYVANYLYLAYLSDVIEVTWASWAIALLVCAIILAVAYFINKEFIVVGVFFLLASKGLVLWVAVAFSLFVGALVALLVSWKKLQTLGGLLWDSLLLAIILAFGVIGFIVNWSGVDPSPECSSKHFNMFIVCDVHCGSIVANDNVPGPRWSWIAAVTGFALIRFFWVYSVEICNKPPAENAKVKQEQKDFGCCWYCCHPTPAASRFHALSKPVAEDPNARFEIEMERPKGGDIDKDGDEEGDDDEGDEQPQSEAADDAEQKQEEEEQSDVEQKSSEVALEVQDAV